MTQQPPPGYGQPGGPPPYGQPGGPTPYPRWDAPDRLPARAVRSNPAASILIGLLVTPIALAILDFGVTRIYQRLAMYAMSSLSPSALLALLVGLALLVLVAAAGRWSPLGPLLAAIIWGAIPTVWQLIDPRSFFAATYHLPRLPGTRAYWFSYSGFVAFPLVMALLIGVAIAVRRRAV